MASLSDSAGLSSNASIDLIITAVNILPMVDITSPLEGAVFFVGEIITFNAISNDVEDGDVGASIEWSSDLDGALGVGASISSGLTIGTHRVSAVVTDSDSASATSSISLTIIAMNISPTVNITSPADGSVFIAGASINFISVANDLEDGDLGANIMWSSDLDGAIGVGATINTALSLGAHQITAKVTDSNSASATSSINITLIAPNNSPTINIITPADGSAFTEGENIIFSSTAADVEDGDLSASIVWSSDVGGALGIGDRIVVSLTAGMHEISATVVDSGNHSAMRSIGIKVEPPANQLPTIAIAVPADGSTYKQDDVVAFAGTAFDVEDGDLAAAIIWSSDLDGALGVGANITATLSLGAHEITAFVADSASGSDLQVVTIIINAPDNPVTRVTLNTSIDSPQTQGALVILTAQVSGGNSVEYQFRVKRASTGNKWRILQDYSAASSVVWDTAGVLGKHRLQVKARDGDNQDTPVKKAVTFWLNDVNPVTEVILTASESSPVTVGALITLTAQGVGGPGNYEYQFRLKGPATNAAWIILQDASLNNTVVTDTTNFLGKNRVQVRSRNFGSSDRWVKDTQTLWVNSLNPASAVTLVAGVASPQTEGSLVTLTGQGAGGTGSFQYQFRVKGPETNGKWLVLQDFSAVATTIWNTTGFNGINRVQVKARNVGSLDRPVQQRKRFTITN